jgi:uncharacterized protein YjdB/agmatine/peptidylarginine deiminase
MSIKAKPLFMLFAFCLILQLAKAQYPEWNDPNSLPIWMTPEEEARKHEIGKNFLKSATVTGPVRSVAEFERMEGVLIRYPLGLPTSLIAAWSQHTIVYTLAGSSRDETRARDAYRRAGANLNNCLFIRAATDSYWTRDYGPWYIVDQENRMSILDFPYNRPRPNDNAVPGAMATYLNIPLYSMNVIHTGGNYMSDGWAAAASTDLVYEENGNDQAWVDQQMMDNLGITDYHVTIDPLDDYIKHIDCWGKFLDVDKVLITEVSSGDSRYDDYEFVASYFAGQTSAYGTPYQVFRVYSPDGQPYTNSVIINHKVYVPITNSAYDNAALDVYRQAMPGYTVTGIYYSGWQSTDALHCRVIGLADRQMLYIKHLPLVETQDYQPEFEITADFVPLSGQPLHPDSLFLIYKTDVRPYDTVSFLNVSGDTYSASLPVNPGETEVSYYLFAADQSGKRENHPFIGKPDPHVFQINPSGVVVDFTASSTQVAVGLSVTFTDNSAGGPFSSWSWNFGQDAVPASANTQGPHEVYYTSAGSKTVSLTVDGIYSATKENYIAVVVPVKGISVYPDIASVGINETLQLTAEVLPENATNKQVTWSSSNTDIAIVDASGLVTGISEGPAVITATTVDGGYTAACEVTVTIPVTGVTVSPETASLTLDEYLQLTADVLPENASNKKVTWSSNNTNVAEVDAKGLVIATGEGSATITATTEDGGFTASCEVTVSVPVTGITVNPVAASLGIGESLQLTASVKPENAGNKQVSWLTGNPDVAIVDPSGIVTATGAGTTTVTATTDDGGYMAACEITSGNSGFFVTATCFGGDIPTDDGFTSIAASSSCPGYLSVPIPSGAAIESVDVSYSMTSAHYGYIADQRSQLRCTSPGGRPEPEIASGVGSGTGTYPYERTGLDIANSMTGGGDIQFELHAGRTWSSAGYSGCQTWNNQVDNNTWTITVHYTMTQVAVTGISLIPEQAGLLLNETVQLVPEITPENATNKQVNWASSDNSVATVNVFGLVTAMGEGQAIISAVTVDGGFEASAEISVTVPVTGVTVSPEEATLNPEEELQLTAVIQPENATDKRIEWSSSNPDVAVVTSSGLVTATGAGTAEITVTTFDGNYTAKSLINVVQLCNADGYITFERWDDIPGSSISDLTENINYPDNPTLTTTLTEFRIPSNAAQNYGCRVSGYLCVPETGTYQFWISGDGNVELWLSFDEQEANKMLIAYHTDKTRSEQWNRYSTQKSNYLYLTQGQSCYIEALMKHGTGNDNMAVGWLKPGETGTIPSEIIPGSVLSPRMLTEMQKSSTLTYSKELVPENPSRFIAYPNPTTGKLSISASKKPESPVRISIISMSGQIVREELVSMENDYMVDLDGLVTGFCIIRIESGKVIQHEKIVIIN